MHTLAKLIRVVLLLSSMTLFLACDPPVEDNASIRILTLNTQLLTKEFVPNILDPLLVEQIMHALGEVPDVENDYGMRNVKRAEHLANEILGMKRQPEIIAFQEVFDDDAKNVLVNVLKSTYPHYVKELDAIDLDPWDSGLMLFSKLPFAPLVEDKFRAKDVTASSRINGVEKDWKDVAYVEFRYKSNFDTFANKGAGLVRVKIKEGAHEEYMYVVFTHTQASYGSDSYESTIKRVSNRISQAEDIETLIKGSLNSFDLENEPVLVMGDLNINGNFGNLHHKWGDSSVNDWATAMAADKMEHYRKYEWDNHFNRHLGNGFFSTYLSDSWVYDNVRSDYGQTMGGAFPYYYEAEDSIGGERLDYILHNNNKGMGAAEDMSPQLLNSGEKLCVQHIQRVWEPVVGDVIYYTDHLGIMVDVNKCFTHCNPRIAKRLLPNPDISSTGKIKFKEGVQWYEVGEKGGSYSIRTVGNVKIEVYEKSDLSRPINISGIVTDWGVRYSVPTAPFFIKVMGYNQNFTGDYSISIHKHEGKSKDDAIELAPLTYYEENKWKYGYEYQMPEYGKINDDNIVWFIIAPEKGTTGGVPSMKGIIDFNHAPPVTSDYNFMMDIIGDADTSITKSKDIPFPYSEYPSLPTYDMWRSELEVKKVPDKVYYLRVHAAYPDTKGDRFTIQWQTSLTYFIPYWIRCYEQDDNTGDDDIYLWADIDDQNVHREVSLGEFDDGGEDFGEFGSSKAVSFLECGYTKDMQITLREDERGSTSANKFDELGTIIIGLSPMDQEIDTINDNWVKGDMTDDPDYHYAIWAELKHKKPKKSGE